MLPQYSGARLLSFVTQPALKQGHLSCTSWSSPLWEQAATAAGTEAALAPGARTDCKGDDGTSAGALAAAEIKTCTRTQQELWLYFIAQMIDAGA